MTPEEEREEIAKLRWQVIQLCRISGILVMVLGMWIWAGDILREGGWMALGMPIFVVGFFFALWLPVLLARRWKSESGE